MCFIEVNSSDPCPDRFLFANVDYGSRGKTGFLVLPPIFLVIINSPRFVTQLKNLISFILDSNPPSVYKE